MKIGVYCRYSSENQRESSIEDQLRNCQKHAEQQGWIISPELVFSDAAISGGVSVGRPGYQGLMNAVKQKQIDVILVDSLDRLSRDQEELHRVYKQFKFYGVALVGVSDGYNGDDKLAKVNLAVKGLMSEMFLDDLKEKTRRGMEGRFRQGFSSGGGTYGYKSIPIVDPLKVDTYGRSVVIGAKKEVEPNQASVIQKIFKMFVEGYSTKKIAHHLNELGVSSPRGKKGGWTFSTISGSRKKALGILNNWIYVGKPIWNRTEKVKNPSTERRVSKPRPQSEWLQTDVPELRIISDELWEAAKIKQDQQARLGPFYKQVAPKHLLSGLVVCSLCGCRYILQHQDRYECSGHLNRGNAICNDTESLFRDELEASIIGALSEDLIDAEHVSGIICELEKVLSERRAQENLRAPSLQKQLKKAMVEKENIIKAIKLGVVTPGTKEALMEAEGKIATLEAEMASSNSPKLEFNPKMLKIAVEEQIRNLESFWHENSVQAREQIRTLVDSVVVENREGRTFLKIQGTWERLILMKSGSFGTQLEPGAGLEPATCSLRVSCSTTEPSRQKLFHLHQPGKGLLAKGESGLSVSRTFFLPFREYLSDLQSNRTFREPAGNR